MSSQPTDRAYRVLARKYRPATFADLIGQDALVRTLTNAIAGGRLAHAYLLTGVRGVGKTTTARILARALNCIGADGAGGPTVDPCGVCEHCVAITEDRHVDVLEMDAASRTGIEDIRELIDGVRYRPVMARYKVYIIDEIHMLSKQAFNALLKTLEEPPPHVIFIFATTETRRVPVTVVSRCQRFDLRRVEAALLIGHLETILEREGAKADAGALGLIARAADGSVRDALSILDQAIVHCDGTIDEARVADMLGLADRVRIFDLFAALMRGDIAAALDELSGQYDAGVDPLAVLEDLLDLTHWLTRIKLVPEAARAPTVPEAERRLGGDLAERLAMPALARAWQMLLKGLGEARLAPDPLAATEMVLVRLAHVADLPSPADLVKSLSGASEAPAVPAGAAQAPPPASGGGGASAVASQIAPQTETARPAPTTPPDPTSLEDVIALAEARREVVLATHLRHHLRLTRFEPGRIEFRPTDQAPPRLANDLGRKLTAWTGRRWVAVVASEGDAAATVAERAAEEQHGRLAEAETLPAVKAVLDTFPGARVVEVRARPPLKDDSDPNGKNDAEDNNEGTP